MDDNIYNQKQLKLMLDTIVSYRSGLILLSEMIKKVEGLSSSLKNFNQDWIDKVSEYSISLNSCSFNSRDVSLCVGVRLKQGQKLSAVVLNLKRHIELMIDDDFPSE